MAIFYDNSTTLWRLLAEYFKVGLEQGELGVLVTPFPPEEVTKHFKDLGFDAQDFIMKGHLRIFDMTETYLPDGRFVADFMMKNVMSFIEDAKSQGYSGLRTAGEMGWSKEHDAFHDEASFYEKNVNDLVAEFPSFTGLCLYATESGESPSYDMRHIIDTHPTYFYNGELRRNTKFAN